jgi:S-adenosylmethionine hydrolase
MNPAPIVLLTDFGLLDSYVGVMKGVIHNIAPRTPTIDLTHSIPAGDVRWAAIELWKGFSYFPDGTIFLCVVDPGVGTGRRAIAIQWEQYTFVGPNNGLISYLHKVLGQGVAVELNDSRYHLQEVSSTFHGRDVFAPAAAHLSMGTRINSLGEGIDDLLILPPPELSAKEGPKISGEILNHDHFGNLVTSIGVLRVEENDLLLTPWLQQCPSMRLPLGGLRVHLPNGAILGLRRTFGEAAPGEALAYIGSAGLMEIGINRGHAASVLPIQIGQSVSLSYKG